MKVCADITNESLNKNEPIPNNISFSANNSNMSEPMSKGFWTGLLTGLIIGWNLPQKDYLSYLLIFLIKNYKKI